MRSGAGGPEQDEWGNAINVVLPTFEGGGTHVNVSGAAVAKNAPNKDNAVKLLEFLVSDEAPGALRQGQFRVPGEGRRRGRSDHRRRSARSNVDRLPLAEIAAQPQGGERARRQGRLRQLRRRAEPDAMTLGAVASDSAQRLRAAAMRRRRASGWPPSAADRRSSSSCPIVSLGVDRGRRLGRCSGRTSSPTCCPVAPRQHGAPPSRRRRARHRDRHRHGLAGHGLRLSRPAHPRLGAAPAARGADLHRRLRLSRPPAPDRPGADGAPRASSASPARATSACPTSARCRAAILLLGFVLYPYVYLSTRALFLMQAAGLVEAARTLGAGPAPGLLPGRAAARPAGHRGRRQPRADGDAERRRRLGIPRRPDADRLDLFDLDQPVEPRRRGADRAASCWRSSSRWSSSSAGRGAASASAPRRSAPRRRLAAPLTRLARPRRRSRLGLVPVLIGFVVPALYLVNEALEAHRLRRHLAAT